MIPALNQTSPAPYRLFAAIKLPDSILLMLNRFRRDVPGLKWVPLHNSHLTLRFIGESSTEKVEDIAAALRQVEAWRFAVRIKGMGLFSRNAGSVLWAGTAHCDGLAELKNRIDASLQKGAGIAPDDKSYKPHITLGRMRSAPSPALRTYVRNTSPEVEGVFSVSGFALFHSEQEHTGTVYSALEQFPLV